MPAFLIDAAIAYAVVVAIAAIIAAGLVDQDQDRQRRDRAAATAQETATGHRLNAKLQARAARRAAANQYDPDPLKLKG